MRCCICGEKIDVEPITKWDQGHNASPIREGRCCTDCNTTVVIPERMRRMFITRKTRLD
jgi:hypothetical protein